MTTRYIRPNKMRTRRLLERYHRHGDREARRRVIQENLPLVKYLASKYMGRGESMDDLVQVGSVGLIKAVDRFNPDRQIEFSTYATPNIIGEIKHHFRDKGWTLKVPRKAQELSQSVRDVMREETASTGCAPSPREVSEILGIDVVEVYEALLLSGAYTPDSLNGPARADDLPEYTLMDVQEDESTPLEDVYNKARLQDVIGTLDQSHQDVLNLRFTEGRTKAEMAHYMGVSQSDVPQLLQGAIEQVRSRA
jgi:RNA polymerase sigma-B factor